MALLTDSWFFDILTILTATVTIFISWLKWSHSYWSRRGIITPPTTFFYGNIKAIFKQEESLAEWSLQTYNFFKARKLIHGGSYFLHMPTYIPIDCNLIKHIMQSDFNHFVDRGAYFNEEVDPLSAHLFSLEGAKWRNLRMKLTPTFTSGKMKMMFDTLVKCGDQLTTEMDKTVNEAIDIKDILARFTTDIIGNCAFGIDCNSLKDPDNEFNRYMKLFLVEDFWQNIKGFISFVTPGVAKTFGMKIVHPALTKFFMRIVNDTVSYREKNNIYRKDFMHLLLQLKNRGRLVDDESIVKDQSSETLTMNEIAAQAFLFFLAGFETSSTTMTFALFELASNPEIQETLRQEIDEVLNKHGKLTYDAIMEMHYMEKVINETLRKYPPVPILNRICTKEYKVPGTNLVIEEGTKLNIPILGLQRDPDFYPEPEKFDPERFSEENKRKRHTYAFLPFGEGPRVCIGVRFGMMQTKVGLSVLLKNYRFFVNSKTNLPMQFDPRSFIMTNVGGIWLDYKKV